MPESQNGGPKISSPNELEREGFIRIRGRILGNARLGKKAGIAVLAILALIFGAILYGVTLNKPRVAALRQQYAKPLPPPETSPWWQNQSDAALAVAQPTGLPSTPEPAAPPTVQGLAPSTPPTELPAVSTPYPATQNRSHLTSANAKFPTIPLLDVQSLPVNARSTQSLSLSPATSGQDSRRMMLEAAMIAPLLVRAPATNAESRSGAPLSSGDSSARQADLDDSGTLIAPTLSFQLKAGTIIPAALITAIDSDLPGLLTAQVRENVYDSVSGEYLLIPQGSKIIGAYDSRVSYGQERLLVTWTRLMYPDGSSLDLKQMAGADLAGRSGFDALVDNHARRLFQDALLLSIIGAGAQLSQPQQSAGYSAVPSVGQIIAGSIGSQIASAGTQIVQRQLNVPPNLRVPAGYQFDVIVDHDIVIAGPYHGG